VTSADANIIVKVLVLSAWTVRIADANTVRRKRINRWR